MHHRLLLHIVWVTREREPLITTERALQLLAMFPVIARQERSRILEMGIVTTHVHLLIRAHPTTQLPRLMQRLKGGSAFQVNRIPDDRSTPLRWGKGYSMTTVSPRDHDRVAAYVREQAAHHPDQAIPGISVSRR